QEARQRREAARVERTVCREHICRPRGQAPHREEEGPPAPAAWTRITKGRPDGERTHDPRLMAPAGRARTQTLPRAPRVTPQKPSTPTVCLCLDAQNNRPRARHDGKAGWTSTLARPGRPPSRTGYSTISAGVPGCTSSGP